MRLANTMLTTLTKRHATQTQTIDIIVDGMTAYVPARVMPGVRQLLETPNELLPATDEISRSWRAVPLKWFRVVRGQQDIPANGRWVPLSARFEFLLPPGKWYGFPAGLVPDVLQHLQEQGWNVTFRFPPVPGQGRVTADKSVLRNAVADQRDFLNRVRHLPRGLVAIESAVQAMDYTALISRLFPQARLGIVVYTVEQAHRAQRQLAERLDEPIGFVRRHKWRDAKRITVVTFSTLQETDPHQLDILVVPNALDVLGRTPQKALKWLPAVRTYGFVKGGLPRDLRSSLVIEAFIGLQTYSAVRLPDRAQVRVLTCDAPFDDLNTCRTALEHKRAMLWANVKRNQLIGDLATAIAGRDLRRLQQLNLLTADGQFPFPAERPLRIVILCESTEHARNLKDLLPCADLVQKNHYTADRLTIPARRPVPSATITIMTTVATMLTDWQADIVIRATGEVSTRPSNSLPRIVRNNEDEQDCQLLIDVGDDFDRDSRRNMHNRRHNYRQHGWRVE